ncbi:MAG: asparagine synthase (glutamine-hydrolyzing) [Thermodesulfobacteriota bacterium]
MCGICGYLTAPAGEPAREGDLAAMLAAIRHRGREDGQWQEGPAGLACRRLPILDLAGSRQPLANEDGSLVLVGNGEIYNWRTLRQDLEGRGHRFRTQGDLECLLHLYEEEQEGFLARLRGMFAFALYDRRANRLLLARDHLGVKPLFYTQAKGTLFFASEIKALTALPQVGRTLSPQALADYLALQFVPRPGTVYQEIAELAPASFLKAENGRLTTGTYWQLPLAEATPPPSLAEAAGEVMTLLRRAVARRLMADVPVGVLLSGGVDSSAIAALTREIAPEQLNTFAIVFAEESFDESRYSRLMAQRLGSRHHELVLDEDTIAGSLAEIAYFFDEPFCEGSAIPIYHICRLASPKVTVLLSGEGADETLGGYETYQARHLSPLYSWLPAPIQRGLAALASRLPVSDRKVSLDLKLRRFTAGAGLSPAAAHCWWRAAMSDADKRRILDPGFLATVPRPDSAALYEAVLASIPGRDLLNRLMATDCRLHLVDDLLLRADRMSMAHTMEIRVPFLDVDLVEAAFRIPSPVKIRGLANKRPLRHGLKGLLPESIRTRVKKGLNMPYQKWFKRRRWRELLHDTLAPARLGRHGLFQAAAVQGLLAEHEAGRANHSHALWAMMHLVLWLDANRAGGPA